MPGPPDLHTIDGEHAGPLLSELSAVYAEVYADPPYEWGEEHVALFQERFEVQRRHDGFRLVLARAAGELVGFGFGVTLLPGTPWWQNLLTALPDEVTRERPGRTWALVELMVRARWRRRHVAEAIHEMLLDGRAEERATLTVLLAAGPARAAYEKWGWQLVGRKRNPLPGGQVFEVMLKDLNPRGQPSSG